MVGAVSGAMRPSGDGTGSRLRQAPPCPMPRRRLRATPRPSARARSTWVKSSTPDVDLQATISEVRPDGSETFVQNGWIRASERKLATNSNNIFQQTPTLLQPIPTFLASDVQPMPANQFVPVIIPLYFEWHAYRAGSRVARVPRGLAHQGRDCRTQRNTAGVVVRSDPA